jgi:gas vesicle protein
MSENGGSGSFFFGFLIGAMTGAAAAVLLTPQSGEELRRTIEQRSATVMDDATRAAEEVKVQSQRFAEQARGQVEVVGEKGRIVLTENVRKAQQAVVDAKEKLSAEPPAAEIEL